jgi:hypothetical protein
MDQSNEEIKEPVREFKDVCGKCMTKIFKAFNDLLSYPVEVGDSVDTETDFIDDKTGRKFTLYIKLKNDGAVENE